MITPEASWDLPDTIEAPRLARSLLVNSLEEWGAESLADDAQLLVSELVTNAVVHGRSRSRLQVRLRVEALWIGVHDFGGGTPAIREPDATGGRGLRVVEHLASGWQVDADGSEPGKTIWCELAR